MVTIIGMIWDRLAAQPERPKVEMPKFVGLQRLGACWAFICRELCGPTGALALVAILGVGILGRPCRMGTANVG